MHTRALLRHLAAQEAKWRSVVEAKVKVYSAEEIAAYIREREEQEQKEKKKK